MLSNVLNSSHQGRELQKIYKHTNNLQDASRKVLVDLIVDHFLTNDIDFTPKAMVNITEQLLDIFPNEKGYEV